MSIAERVKRYVIMVSGLFFIALGVAFSTKAGLGTSPLSAIPYTLGTLLPQASYGAYVGGFNALLALAQVLILRSKCNWFDIAQQLVLCAIFGSFVDAAMLIISWLNPSVYPLQVVILALAIASQAFGSYLQLISHVGLMAADGLCRVLTQVTHSDFGRIRVITDSSMAATALAMNLVAFHRLLCIREGTIVMAALTGTMVHLFSKWLTRFEHVLIPQNFASADDEHPILGNEG